MAQRILLFLFQFAAHVSFLYAIPSLTFNDFLITLFFYFLFTGIGSDATFHRLLAHGSYKPPTWFYYFGNICGVLGGVGSGLAWVANHRAHHKYSDTPNDPHSPHHKGFMRVQFFSMFEPVNMKYAGRLFRLKSQLLLHKYYWAIHLVYFLALWQFYPKGIVTMYLAPAALTWTVSGLINNFCHLLGSRVSETSDKSTNNWIIGIISFGEGYHNYHHSNATDYRYGHQKYEFDLVARIIETVKV